ncbi:SRG1-like protein [Tanacetum coccineum]
MYVTPSQSPSTSPVPEMAAPVAKPFLVEVCLKPSSTARINDVKFTVERDSLDILVSFLSLKKAKKSGKKSGMKAVVADKGVKEESHNGTTNQVATTSFPKRLFKITMAKSLELEDNCFSKHFTEERDVLQGRSGGRRAVESSGSIMSNGIFKSPVHRVVTNSEKGRIYVAMFTEPEPNKEMGIKII